MHRHRTRAQIEAVTAVLHRDWDPIGAGGRLDLPPNEYESYAPRLLGMIRRGATDAAIAMHLARLETDFLGTPSGRDLVVVARRVRGAVVASK
jgi:hypothetical protein